MIKLLRTVDENAATCCHRAFLQSGRGQAPQPRFAGPLCGPVFPCRFLRSNEDSAGCSLRVFLTQSLPVAIRAKKIIVS
eukprot:s657_g15.t1